MDEKNCAACDSPDGIAGFMARMQVRIAMDIATMGQSMIGVLDDQGRNRPPFIYTIGNAERGLPELLIIGAANAMVGEVLNLVGQKMRERGQPFADNELIPVGGKFPLKVINADAQAKEDYTIQAGEFLGRQDYAVQQILLPDQKGRFPDDPRCDERYAFPVLHAN